MFTIKEMVKQNAEANKCSIRAAEYRIARLLCILYDLRQRDVILYAENVDKLASLHNA